MFHILSCPPLLKKRQIRKIIRVFKRIHGKKSHIFKRFLALYNLESQRWSVGSSYSFDEWLVTKLLHHLKHILLANHPQIKELGRVSCPERCACCNCISGWYQILRISVVLQVKSQIEQLVQTPDEFDWLFRLHAKQAMKKAWTFFLDILRSSEESRKRFYSREVIAALPSAAASSASASDASDASASAAASALPAKIYD